MPQPLRYRKGELKVGPAVLLERPKLAVQMALIMSYWAAAEHNFGMMFVTLLAGEDKAALSIFGSLIDRSLREQAFLSVAQDKLPPELIERFVIYFKKTRSVASARNDVAHGLWAILSTRPNSILLCPKDFRRKQMNEVLTSAFGDRPLYISLEGEEYMEYTYRDFINIQNRIRDLEVDIMPLFHELGRICLLPKLTRAPTRE